MNFPSNLSGDWAVRSFVRMAVCWTLAWGGLSCPSHAVAQQSSALSAVYGRGVHAYFAGKSSLAEQHFTQVIQAGSTDPRPYYFRAMVRMRSGRKFEAENDMRVGAGFEARNPGSQQSIGRALQRVQGPDRRTLEAFRRQARLDRLQKNRQQTRQRYEQIERRGPAVLRQAVPVPLEQSVEPPQAPAPVGSGAKAGSATKEGSTTRAGSASKQGSGTREGSEAIAGSGMKPDPDDPFGAPAPVTPEDDPFGAPTPSPEPAVPTQIPTQPAQQPIPQSESAPAADDDPFGEPASPAAKEDDPFGGGAPEESAPVEPAEDDPFGDTAPAPSDDEPDPFGATAEDEVMEEPEESADEAADDPFGEPSPVEDDPFGEPDAPADAEDDPFAEEPDAGSDPPEGDSEPADDAPADETPADDAPADDAPADDDDPFGPLGALSPQPAVNPAGLPATTDASSSPAGQLFFALGQWIGSAGSRSSAAETQFGSDPADFVDQADFELGPSKENQATPAAVELPTEDDPFSVPSDDESLEEKEPLDDDPFADPESATDSASDSSSEDTDSDSTDPFDDDPFGDSDF